MKTYNITPAMTLAAEAMIANDMDYWPHGLIDYPASEGVDYCLYAYDDGVWLVDTNNTCHMNDAVQLVKVLSSPKENSMDDKTIVVGGLPFTLFSEYNENYLTVGFGWHEGQNGRNNTGAMYNGKPYSVSRAKFTTYEKACEDLADHVSYRYGIRRSVTKEALK